VKAAHDPAAHDPRRPLSGRGGRYQAQSGQVIATDAHDQSFKVVLTFPDGSITEHPCETVQDGRHFIRRCVGSASRPASRRG